MGMQTRRYSTAFFCVVSSIKVNMFSRIAAPGQATPGRHARARLFARRSPPPVLAGGLRLPTLASADVTHGPDALKAKLNWQKEHLAQRHAMPVQEPKPQAETPTGAEALMAKLKWLKEHLAHRHSQPQAGEDVLPQDQEAAESHAEQTAESDIEQTAEPDAEQIKPNSTPNRRLSSCSPHR